MQFKYSKVVTVDGVDGVGKSTLVQGAAKRITDVTSGRINVITLTTPGDTTTLVGAWIRQTYLRGDRKLDPVTEAFLFASSVTELHDQCILPARLKAEENKQPTVILVDRYVLSLIGYQVVPMCLDLARKSHDQKSTHHTLTHLVLPAINALITSELQADAVAFVEISYVDTLINLYLRDVKRDRLDQEMMTPIGFLKWLTFDRMLAEHFSETTECSVEAFQRAADEALSELQVENVVQRLDDHGVVLSLDQREEISKSICSLDLEEVQSVLHLFSTHIGDICRVPCHYSVGFKIKYRAGDPDTMASELAVDILSELELFRFI